MVLWKAGFRLKLRRLRVVLEEEEEEEEEEIS